MTFRQFVCSLLPGTGVTETEDLEATTRVVTKLLLPSTVPSKPVPIITLVDDGILELDGAEFAGCSFTAHLSRSLAQLRRCLRSLYGQRKERCVHESVEREPQHLQHVPRGRIAIPANEGHDTKFILITCKVLFCCVRVGCGTRQ